MQKKVIPMRLSHEDAGALLVQNVQGVIRKDVVDGDDVRGCDSACMNRRQHVGDVVSDE